MPIILRMDGCNPFDALYLWAAGCKISDPATLELASTTYGYGVFGDIPALAESPARYRQEHSTGPLDGVTSHNNALYSTSKFSNTRATTVRGWTAVKFPSACLMPTFPFRFRRCRRTSAIASALDCESVAALIQIQSQAAIIGFQPSSRRAFAVACLPEGLKECLPLTVTQRR
ncbi:uncharacterized protein BCR38DRAFT_404745 [Pseudomassariella vexata]|uniref:Uncharacterized protein n=1 Tax=Pseudomassariella vexata TaxID=1141098 RepID=A0A1Y2EJG7_9PEZI|nr:uncharacterized protein BCR38DRAFT_404745 [Pseudomassariella vexata]ORY71691.1 hypothetical protein BCR38DRAFT_404745 [Pseudomassariella vexata]